MRNFNCSVFLFCIFSFILFTFQSCTNPIGPANGFTLSAADVSCTEAWLNLHINTVPANVTINKNGTALFTMKVAARDTIIYDSTLSPGKNYSYQALVAGIKSNQATVKTLDTTSHNFTWQLFTLGDALAGNGSMLYDAAIINEDDIWVVGEIYLKDSVQMYNAAHWDGQKWNLLSIHFINSSNQSFLTFFKSVYAFGSNDVWFAADQLIHWDGNNFKSIEIPTNIYHNWINKIYGTSDNDLYIIGKSGSLARYNGTSWSKIQSGTTLDLFDIYSNDGKDIYAGGGNYMDYSGVLLECSNNNCNILKEGKNVSNNEIFNPYFVGVASAVWTSNTNAVYFGGHFLYRYIQGQLDFVKSLPGNYPGGNSYAQNWGLINKLRGNGNNDIIIAGERNTLKHFNGVSWQQLGMPYDPNSNYDWFSIIIKSNIAVAVGFFYRNATVMLLKRQ